jgi:hypothetical protein
LAGAALAAIAMSAAGVVSAIGSAPSELTSFEASFGWTATFHWVCVFCFGWMGAEGLGEWRRSRRRVVLGLSDPLVCHRLLMWGLFGCSTTLLCLVLAAASRAVRLFCSPSSRPGPRWRARGWRRSPRIPPDPGPVEDG